MNLRLWNVFIFFYLKFLYHLLNTHVRRFRDFSYCDFTSLSFEILNGFESFCSSEITKNFETD